MRTHAKTVLMCYIRSKMPELVTSSQAVLQKYQKVSFIEARESVLTFIFTPPKLLVSACAYSCEHVDPDLCRWTITCDLCGAGRASAQFSPYRAQNCVVLGLIMTPEPFIFTSFSSPSVSWSLSHINQAEQTICGVYLTIKQSFV